jgi:hypothetical protein
MKNKGVPWLFFLVVYNAIILHLLVSYVCRLSLVVYFAEACSPCRRTPLWPQKPIPSPSCASQDAPHQGWLVLQFTWFLWLKNVFALRMVMINTTMKWPQPYSIACPSWSVSAWICAWKSQWCSSRASVSGVRGLAFKLCQGQVRQAC